LQLLNNEDGDFVNKLDAWVGRCHIVNQGTDNHQSYNATAAVFCTSAVLYQNILREHIRRQGYELMSVTDVLPFSEWVRLHAEEKDSIKLARLVNQWDIVKVGSLIDVTENLDAQSETDYLTTLEHEVSPLPDQSDIPFWDKEWIAPELKEILFSKPDNEEQFKTYFIVDAGLRKNITKVYDLDDVDVPIRCLYTGDAASEQEQVAPYIVDMTLPEGAWDEKDIVPDFHKDFFDKHWNKDTGIFIRTQSNIDTVWEHFRKFTRVQMEDDGRWVVFRFFDPRTISTFVEALERDDVHKFLGQHSLINLRQLNLKVFRATTPLEEAQRRTLPALQMKEKYVAAFAKSRKYKFRERLQHFISGELPRFKELTPDRQDVILKAILEQSIKHGIKIERAVAQFTLASILFGQDPANDPKLEQTLRSDMHQLDKTTALLHEVRSRLSSTH
jgi:hypothetical protein